jgi:succinoglycan biosynthesis protein ExoO
MCSNTGSRPLISVIMANYRAGRYIERALNAVLAQTLSDIEVIVSDDASPDDSVARVLDVQRRDPRVRLLLATDNGGPARARNRALDDARGEWIALVDSDDLIHPERFERLFAAAQASKVDAIADDLLYFHENGAPSRLLLPEGQHAPLDVSAIDWILAGDNGLPPLGYLKPIFRTSALRDLRYDETLRIGEDYDFMLRFLLGGGTLQVVPEPWYFYRRHDQSVSHRFATRDLEAMIASQRRFAAGADTLEPHVENAMAERLAKLEAALSFERLVGAVKRRELGTAVQIVSRHPTALLRLGRAAAEHVARRVPRDEPIAPALVVLSDDHECASDLADAVLIEVPAYRSPQHQVTGGAARRRLWRQIADLARAHRPEILVRGAGGAYAAGFIPSLASGGPEAR